MRPDGKPIAHDDPMYMLIPYFMTKRYDAMNMITLDIPEAPMRAYMNEKRREGTPVSHMALLITAYLLTLKKYPDLNRFIVGKRIYQRKEISVSMAVLKPGGEDTMSKIYLSTDDDVMDVQRKITEYIDQNRQAGEANALDKAMNILVRLRLLTSFLIGLVKLADRLGLLPNSLIRVSPFHASLLVSNLASIRTNHIFHHIYQFGTTSISITMGNLREVPRRGKDGVTFERCIPLGLVMDERIANGHYFAQAFSVLKGYLADPRRMEKAALLAEENKE